MKSGEIVAKFLQLPTKIHRQGFHKHKQRTQTECEQQEDAWLWFVIVWGVVDIDSARSWRPSREAWQAV